jgi:hypothetical protein
MLKVLDAISFVFEVMLVEKEAIVEELTPPTLFTIGALAVPPKSFVNLILPLVVASASGVTEPPSKEDTNAVVAI